MNFLNLNFKCKGIVNDFFGGRFFVFKCLIIYIFFIFVYEFWYFYVLFYGFDIIMMGYYFICGYINIVGFFNYIVGEKSCFIFVVEIKFILNIFVVSVELIMYCFICDCRCWVFFLRNMINWVLISWFFNMLKLLFWINRRILVWSLYIM